MDAEVYDEKSLNPCFTGTQSLSAVKSTLVVQLIGLNPCFTGTQSLSMELWMLKFMMRKVLILVLLELSL